jgi:hypothetical protein
MVLKKIVMFVIVCVIVSSLSSVASAQITVTSWIDSEYLFSGVWNWNPEVADSFTYTDSWWKVDIAIADGGTTWDVTWGFTHIDGPHDYDIDPNVSGPYNDSFSKSAYGTVISDLYNLDSHTPDYDNWSFTFQRPSPTSTSIIYFNAAHTPEPVSSVLFLAGAITMGFRLFKM